MNIELEMDRPALCPTCKEAADVKLRYSTNANGWCVVYSHCGVSFELLLGGAGYSKTVLSAERIEQNLRSLHS